MNTAILQQRPTHNRYYGDFRGVDFSSDHTQVDEHRLAYAANMFKDYQSGQGQALETIPGFRKRIEIPGEPVIYGIHKYLQKAGSVIQTKVLIHAGTKLYLWHNYPNSINVMNKDFIILPHESTVTGTTKTFNIQLGENVAEVKDILKTDGESILMNMDEYNTETHILTVSRSDLSEGDGLTIQFFEGVLTPENALFSGMNERQSTAFVFNSRMYIVDGKNYLVYDGETVTSVLDNAYIPTTYINIIPTGENADIGTEFEQRSVLQSKFKHTFIADGTNTVFTMNESDLDAITEVKAYTKVLTETTDYTVDLAKGTVTFLEAPKKPQDVTEGEYPEFYAGIVITAKKQMKSISGVTSENADISTLITGCTIATVFDNRIFVSGNPAYPNHVFYCSRNTTGYVDPTYFGILNYMQDGVGHSPITGMIPVADTLMVLKADTQQDGAVYFHTPTATTSNIQPKIYPSAQGLHGIGCLGACVNFLDDPIFISRLGVEAVGQLSVRYERAIEHRSSLIDAKLLNCDLRKAKVCEWNGYLIVLCEGQIYMADSRQKYMHQIGVPQYEWYYLEDIGIYKGQYAEYKYSKYLYDELVGVTVPFTPSDSKTEIQIPLAIADAYYDVGLNEVQNLTGLTVNPPDDDGKETNSVLNAIVTVTVDEKPYNINVSYSVMGEYNPMTKEFLGYKAYLCEAVGNQIGGVFKPAVMVKDLDSNLFFGTENGIVCSFNFDKRNEYGEIDPNYYSFDDRIIYCGCATKMDCCGIPDLNKTTAKKSTVIKTKSMQTSAIKIKVRTNKKPYNQIARINSTRFSFGDMDFSDFSFESSDQSLFAVKEKEKKWVEKQYFLYSDEYLKPFALYYISYRYYVAGRYKE